MAASTSSANSLAKSEGCNGLPSGVSARAVRELVTPNPLCGINIGCSQRSVVAVVALVAGHLEERVLRATPAGRAATSLTSPLLQRKRDRRQQKVADTTATGAGHAAGTMGLDDRHIRISCFDECERDGSHHRARCHGNRHSRAVRRAQ